MNHSGPDQLSHESRHGDHLLARWRARWISAPRAFRVLARLQVVAVATAALTALVVAELGTDHGYRYQAFAVPATESATMPWQSEVDAFGHKVSQAFGVRRATATEFAGWILEASERQELEPELLASLVLTESSFRKHAVSHVGAVGPAQVRPDFWGRFCGGNLDDPADNIYCGAQVLSHLRERCGDDVVCALRAYNVGMHSSEVQAGKRYVAKIDRYREHLRDYPL